MKVFSVPCPLLNSHGPQRTEAPIAARRAVAHIGTLACQPHDPAVAAEPRPLPAHEAARREDGVDGRAFQVTLREARICW